MKFRNILLSALMLSVMVGANLASAYSMHNQRYHRSIYSNEWYDLINRNQPAAPDLVISDIYLTSSNNIVFKQANIGDQSIGRVFNGVTHIIISDGTSYSLNWNTISNKDFKRVNGETEVFLHQLQGNHSVTVCIDKGGYAEGGVINELNERNNCKTRWLIGEESNVNLGQRVVEPYLPFVRTQMFQELY